MEVRERVANGRADMKKKVDAIKADIISGKVKAADYMADNACKY